MIDIQIDISADEADHFDVENPFEFDLRIVGCGLTLDLNHDQAKSLYDGLAQFFEDEYERTED
jgi:hypothetical protein